MRRVSYIGFALALAGLFAAPAWSASQTYFGFHLGITNAPPPPVVFYDEPVVHAVPGYPVYVADDCPYDMFRYGPSWYLFDAGFWYRGRSYRGPFVAVDVRYVPRPVLHVPASHWKHRYHGRRWDGARKYGSGKHRYRDRGLYGRSWDDDRGYRNRGYDSRTGRVRGRSWQGRGSRDGEWRYGPIADAQYRDYSGRERGYGYGDRGERRRGSNDDGKGRRGNHKGSRKHRDRDD
jgi:hypothetical protein